MSCLLLTTKQTITGWSYFDVDPLLMADEMYVTLGLKLHGCKALVHANISLRTNISFMRKAYAMASHLPLQFRLELAPSFVRADIQCLASSAQMRPFDVCRFGSRATLIANPAIALAAVSFAGTALQYLPDVLRDRTDIVLTSVRNSGAALQYASARLRQKREIVATALKVQVPKSAKLTLLMGCNVQPKVLTLTQCRSQILTCPNLSIHDKRTMSRLIRPENEHLRRSRLLMCVIGGVGRPLLGKIFEYAAWEPAAQRDTSSILRNVNPIIAEEWIDDVEATYFGYQQALAMTEREEENAHILGAPLGGEGGDY
jgi:hypothetical protein